MKKELNFIADSFKITTCLGASKLFNELDNWELLNLQVPTILEIPERLYDDYGITSKYLDAVMKNYTIQSVSKDKIEADWGIKHTPQLFVAATKHYSWPKAAAIAGIGSDNAVDVPVDIHARVDIPALRKLLDARLKAKKAVYAVVAVMGTTEEGAVDPLGEIIKLRKEYQKLGMSFIVHADAAWGGYFASMIPVKLRGNLPVGRRLPSYVPRVGLRPETQLQLRHLHEADSITVDPHKAGYIPYPAGGLCYRDGRMRYLLTWTAPYINQGVGESIGVYGVEGSKPGASAAAVWLAHEVIGLDEDGHGALLGEASFTCRRFASHWAAMSTDDTDFRVVPFNLLPSEMKEDATKESIDKEKQFIRDHILGVSNIDLVKDTDAMKLLNELGSDLNINAFACNFRYPDGRVNTDIGEANYLNQRIFERLSVTSSGEDPLSVPFYLTSTVFAQKDYDVCATRFKQRLQLEGDQDLFVLRNVVMSPFATEGNFVAKLAKTFQQVLEEEVKAVVERNTPKPGLHSFVMQGTDKLHLVHMPAFHMESGRYQFIFTADLSGDMMKRYRAVKEAFPESTLILKTTEPALLDDLVNGGAFKAAIYAYGA
ncbi:hypothetical protein HGRIS_014175 [Hohenbuehelia grisea]|uniref:Uncharacterized protein n=1 Tax=Hohenbuehelia grisea TaxID=104357 RepID=A0ABR3JSV1_9AGAR